MNQASYDGPISLTPDESGILRINGQRLRSPLEIRDVSAQRIEIVGSTFRADVTLVGCTVDVLAVENVRMVKSSALSVQNCKIDSISIRSVRGRTPISVQHVRAGSVTIHDVPAASISTTSVAQMLRLSRLGGHLRIFESSATQVLLQNLDEQAMKIDFSRFTCYRDIRIESGVFHSIEITDSTARDVSLQALQADAVDRPALSVHGCHVSKDLLVERVSSLGPNAVHLSDTRLEGSVILRLLESAGAQHASLERCVVDEDLRLFDLAGDDKPLVRLIESEVRKSIVIGDVTELIRTKSAPLMEFAESRADDVTIPTARYRGPGEIADVVRRLFGSVDVNSVDLMRNIFRKQHRALSEDAAYVLLQELMTDGSLSGRFRKLVYGGLMGWGVQVWPPVRAFLIFILVTSVALWVAAPPGPLWYRGVTSVINAVGLWTNIPTLEVVSAESALYAAGAGLCGALGLILITVIVGVIIRKLVR